MVKKTNAKKQSAKNPLNEIEKALNVLQELRQKAFDVQRLISDNVNSLSDNEKAMLYCDEQKKVQAIEEQLKDAKQELKDKQKMYGIVTVHTERSRKSAWSVNCSKGKRDVSFIIRNVQYDKPFERKIILTGKENNQISFNERQTMLKDCCLFFGLHGKTINNVSYALTNMIVERMNNFHVNVIGQDGKTLTA